MIVLTHTNDTCTECGDRIDNVKIKLGETQVTLCGNCLEVLYEKISKEIN